MLIPTKFQL